MSTLPLSVTSIHTHVPAHVREKSPGNKFLFPGSPFQLQHQRCMEFFIRPLLDTVPLKEKWTPRPAPPLAWENSSNLDSVSLTGSTQQGWLLNRWFPAQGDCGPPCGHQAMSGDIFGCYHWRRCYWHLTGTRSILLNNQEPKGWPITKNYLAQSSRVPELRKPILYYVFSSGVKTGSWWSEKILPFLCTKHR